MPTPTDWLAVLEPLGIYNHRLAHKLREFGIFYDEKLHLLAHNGVLVEVVTFTPAEITKRGDTEWLNERNAERMVYAADLARAVHQLLRPMETPPSIAMSDRVAGFDADMASIEEAQ